MSDGRSTKWQRPPWNSISAIFSGLVVAGMTATNGRPSIRAKYASLTAVEPLEASTIVLPSVMSPLQSPYRNSERARRCLRLPVGWVDSSLRYRSTPHSAGNGQRSRWVSALRCASASTAATARSTHARQAGSDRSTSSLLMTRCSSADEARLARPVFDEGRHAGLLVLGVEEVGEQPALQLQSLGQRQVQPLVDRPLGRGQGERRAGGELLRHGDGGRVDLLVGDDGVGQTDLERLLRADVPAGEDEVLGLGRTDQAGQPLGTARAGDDAEQDLGLTDLCARAEHPEVGAQGELVAAPEGVTGDRGDDRLGNALHLGEGVGQLTTPGDHRLLG